MSETSAIRFVVEITREYDVARVVAYPVAFGDEQVRTILDSLGSEHPELADLRVSALIGDEGYSGDRTYGWSVEYRDVFSVNLERATQMAKTLRRIERELEKMNTSLGYPESFAAFVARVAAILKVREIGRKVDPAQDFNGTGYRWMDAPALAHHLQSEIGARVAT